MTKISQSLFVSEVFLSWLFNKILDCSILSLFAVPIIPDLFMKKYCTNSTSIEDHAPQNGSYFPGNYSSPDLIPISRLPDYSWYDQDYADDFAEDYYSWFDHGSVVDGTAPNSSGSHPRGYVDLAKTSAWFLTAAEQEKCEQQVNTKTGLLLASKFMMRLVLSAPLGVFTEWWGCITSTVVLNMGFATWAGMPLPPAPLSGGVNL